MDNELTITEIRFIRSLLAVKTDAELAELLGKPVELISDQISLMTGVIKRPKVKREKKARGRPKSDKPKVKKPARRS